MLSLCEEQWIEFYVIFLILFNSCAVVQSLCHIRLFVTPWTAACQASLSFTISGGLLKLMSMSQWYHPTITSSIVPFSSCLLSFPVSVSFPMTWLFASRDYKVWSFSFSISPSNEYSGMISCKMESLGLQSKGLSRVFSNTTVQNHQFFSTQPYLWSIHDYWKNHSFN